MFHLIVEIQRSMVWPADELNLNIFWVNAKYAFVKRHLTIKRSKTEPTHIIEKYRAISLVTIQKERTTI